MGFGGAWRAGRLLWRARSWSVARGRWEGDERGACSGPGPPPPGPRLRGNGGSVSSLSDLRASLSASRCRVSQSWGRSDSLLGNLAVRFPGNPAPRQGGQRRAPEGAGPRALGTTRREWPGTDPGSKDQRARRHTQGPPPCLSQTVSFSRLTSPCFSNHLALRNSGKWEK